MAAPAEQVKHRTTTTRCRVSHSFCLTIFYWWICGVMYVFEWSHACWGWTDAGDGIPEHSKHISHWAHALFLCRINTLAPHNDRIHLWGWMKYIVVTKGADPESTKQQSRRNGRTFWRHIDWFSIKQRRYIFSWWLLGQKPLLYSLQLPLDIGREKNCINDSLHQMCVFKKNWLPKREIQNCDAYLSYHCVSLLFWMWTLQINFLLSIANQYNIQLKISENHLLLE